MCAFAQTSHSADSCMLIYSPCVLLQPQQRCSDSLKEAQPRRCQAEVSPPKGELKKGERFSEIQVLLNISLTAKSLNSREQIIHSLNPACAPLPHWATVWCCCTFPETKWGRGAEAAMSHSSLANEDTGVVFKTHQHQNFQFHSRSNIR